jgi:hypothetical protein
MGKKVKHMGMAMTEQEHEKWHTEHGELTEREHETLTRNMGITKEQHEEWHKKHGVPLEAASKTGQKPINPYAIGGGFLSYCVRQGWLTQEGKGRNARYYATKKGEEELEKFGIRA